MRTSFQKNSLVPASVRIPILLGMVLLGMVQGVNGEIAVTFDVDLTQDMHYISPLIYGSNSDSLTQADGVTFRRYGGNRLTGYNWENNASSAGTDWQNSSDNYLGGGSVPGKAMTNFIDHSAASGSASLVTLQAAGYVARDKKGAVTKEEAAPSARWDKVVFSKGTAFTATPDLTDGEVYMDEFVDFLVKKYGDAGTEKGIKYYSLDNEPALWPSTHPMIHPDAVTCSELVQRSTDLATAVKKVDPKAEIFGGVFYGYAAFASLQDAPDWAAAKDAGGYGWYIDYFLDQMKKASDKAGVRLLDVLDIHWYSEATGDQRINTDGANSDKDRNARLQAPRSLWDSAYAETSWISQWQTSGPILLLPHLYASIQKYYPGTKLAITEYNYGATDQITGGIAEADFLGIMGRENIYAASLWPLNDKLAYAAAAVRLYRNYDGKSSTFGSTSAKARSSDNENASVYASFNSGGDEIHVIALNKSMTDTIRGTFKVTSPAAISAGKVFGFAPGSPVLSERDPLVSVTDDAFTYALPPLSAHHFVLQTKSALPLALKPPALDRVNPAGAIKQGLPKYLPNGQTVRKSMQPKVWFFR